MSSKTSWRIILFLALAVVVSGLGFAWSLHRRQAYLKALGDEVERWGGRANRWANTNPAWDPVRKVIGRGAVDAIAGSDGYFVQGPMNHQVERDQLRQLLEFRPIKTFKAMNASNIDDDWVGGIRDPLVMNGLNLSGTKISDRSIPAILEMRKLSSLNIEHTKLTDGAIDQLRQLPHLTHLSFGGDNVRSIRLLDVWTVDRQDQPVDRADQAARLRGRLAIDPKLGSFSQIEVTVHHPTGTGGVRCRPSNLVELSPGVFSFDVKTGRFTPGLFWVWIRVHSAPKAPPAVLLCHLPLATIQLKGDEAFEDGSKPDRDQ
jgi:hypothetical protein